MKLPFGKRGPASLRPLRQGFEIVATSTRTVPWDEIGTITAYKADRFTTDLVAFEIQLADGEALTIHEEMEGFDLVQLKMRTALPGFDTRWEEKVIQPAFAPNPTVIYTSDGRLAKFRRVTAVVPAAGLAKRMGGANKMLLPHGESTFIAKVVGTLLDCNLDIVVVTGRDADRVAAAAAPARSVINERYQEGLGTSIACGVAACPPENSILIALGDMPDLSAEVVRNIVLESEPEAILAPEYSNEPGRSGHPVLFDAVYREELLGLDGDEGARRVMHAHRDRLRLIPAPGSLPDYDEPW